MKRCAFLLPLLLLGAPAALAQPLTGFTADHAAAQRACEAQLLEVPSPETFRVHLERLTEKPHPAGSEANQAVADYLAETMKTAGLTVERYPYDVYLPSLDTEVEVALVTPVRQPLNNQEDILAEDRFSDDPALGPAFNAFSGSGDVTRPVVYANYGRKEDFERLRTLGVSVEDKIVVARYGGNFRGYKAKYAEVRGAAGLIIYSDPADYGYVQGLVYPEGRYANESTIQRGSLLTLDYWGDPLTPFEPALPQESSENIKRLDPAEVEDLHTIPVAPLPYGAAQEILKRMTGAAVPNSWQGGLPFTYRLTGGDGLTVRLRVEQPNELTRIENVVGTLEGTEHPDEWIVLGAHYDAWTFGAVDPNSGTAMLLTLAEALGQLAENGCAPRRSVKIGHWDAEEQGIIGSSEWVEDLRGPLSTGAVAYLNADAAVSGARFGGAASPSLKGPILEATKAVQQPGTDSTVYQVWQARTPEAEAPALGNLGGGSDHVGFYAHLGIPAAGLGMSGSSPVYHSAYDDFAWYERFADTTFAHGPALARLDGLVALRLARADVLPYDVARYATDLKTHTAALRERAAAQDLDADFSVLDDAAARLDSAAAAFEEARDTLLGGSLPEEDTLAALNEGLIDLERAWLRDEGLPQSAWSRSLYAAPDPFSGYASWMLPGLRYAVETGTGADVQEWTRIYAEAVRALTRRVEALAAQAEKAR